MKPFERAELYTLLDRLQAEIAVEKEQLTTNKKDKQVQSQMRQHVLAGLLTGSIHHGETELLDNVGVQFPLPYTSCLVAKLVP